MTGLDIERTPPQNLEAEQRLLGAILTDARAFSEVVIMIQGTDFYRPAHEQIWNAAKSLRAERLPVDPVTVATELTRRGELERVGGVIYLHTLIASVTVTANATYHAAIVKDLSSRRRLIGECVRNLQDAWQETEPVEVKLVKAEERLRSVPVTEPDFTGTVMSLDEFCDQEVPDNEWVIPGLLARGDRLILTGSEGLGKSVLMRQFAICAAAGVHPFTLQSTPPKVALFVDAENPTAIMVKSFGGMRSAMRANRGPVNEKNLWIERTPAGLNLGRPADQLWLQRLVTLINPDLLCIGPAYKLFRGTSADKEEDLARQVTSVLDSVRESVKCALILEHHAGHGASGAAQREMRPRGSSLWMAWPEFGYGIRSAQGATRENRLVDFTDWRGARDERDWPEQLARGTNFMPWVDASYS